MLTNATIKEIKKLNEKSKERRESGLFVTEGLRMLLETPLEWVEQVYVTDTFLKTIDQDVPADHSYSVRASELIKWMDYETITDEQMRRISDTTTPQGVLCVVRQPRHTLDDILDTGKKADNTSAASAGKNRLIMIIEDIQDPGNLGTIMRTAEGAGASGIVMTRGCVDIFNPKTIRSTMGSVYRVPFVYTDDIVSATEAIRKSGITIYAAHLNGKQYYNEVEYSDSAFMIGNEGNGLTDATAALADTYIKIPMEGELESLNASVAASILMYHHYISRR